MPSKRASNQDRVTQAYQKLRELIVSGRLAPGTRIIESNLTDRLGVSRTPIRSALHRLRQEGYVVGADGRKQSRLFVSPLTLEDAHELFGVVGALESLAITWLAGREPSARVALARDLRHLNAELLRASEVPHPDPREIFDRHTEFHLRYVEAANTPRIRSLHASVLPQAERYRRLYPSTSMLGLRTSVNEHKAILQAIEDGDAAAAAEAVQANWSNGADRLSSVIEAAGEWGSW